ncbi:restriction endonuclease subunit S [Methylomonas sp. LL1]|uniref:restriction endonuclease subunit S n=1 Tax=Methylomonas sp. LL1 TaxID=2785785 RepID=UPI0018C40CDE|nr:restriction endonuclease subunit S [Methylomonas sp. LL1]QPK61671.1 restriction endonuclease subunit S [Methylomonas sp. LL1]
MDAKQFLAEFGHIANAPAGVARLRELILHLAVSGLLTAQQDTENALEFLTEIQLRREALGKQGEIRTNRKIRNEQFISPWQIPPNWLWCRFGELCSFSAGRTPSRKENKYWNTGDYPWFSIADLQHGKIVSTTSETLSEVARVEVFKSAPIPAGSLLMSFKLTIGKLCILGIDAYHNEAIITIEPFAAVLKEFFFKCLNGFDISAGNKAAIKGNTLNQDSISNILIALPPKEEIPRIVAKVDELMALCDELELQQQQRRSLQNNLRLSILQAVAASTNPRELQTNWTRLADNFGQLLQAPQDVAALRDAIFDLALRGWLLPNSTINDTKSEDELPLLPVGWDWQTLGELAEYITSGSRGWKGYISTSGDAFIRSQDIKHDALIFENPAFVSLPEKAEGKRSLVQQGDLLLTITGGNVGKCARVPALGFNAYVSQHVALIRIKKPEQSEFIHFWMTNSYGGRKFLSRYIYGDKPGLNLSQVASVPVPVPPPDVLEEIVRQLKHYGIICDQLLEKIENSSKIAELFAAASVSAISGIRTEEEEHPLKAPKTELIAPLRLGTPPSTKEQAPLAAILAHQNGEMAAKDLWQRFGGEIDAFYAQLKLEVDKGWIQEPEMANMRQLETA